MHTRQLLRFVPASLVLALLGCASSDQKITGWLSSNAEAIAVVDGRVLLGKTNFTREREASVQLQSASGPTFSCTGNLRYTATHAGLIPLQCSDGRSATLNFAVLGAISGTARGNLGNGPFKMTYGLTPDKAAAWLGIDSALLEPPKPAAPTAVAPSG